ncbi:diaminopropionate ammonia-lyase [Rhodoligotrophos defluvii]|uniref:diaminopropionate ammonia-lyase n=1 Tax=Rhodoligotrophos defluvii TaxID=2561934 RepID=UPI0010CA1E8C|nr:diaminopropionate ammonia-lyase [Rhodoligotrophos defluvii]
MAFVSNALPRFKQTLSDAERAWVGEAAPQRVRPFLALWGEVTPTPLVPLPDIAAEAGVDSVLIKDEGRRLGLGSFKALGGAYAVMTLVRQMLQQQLGREVGIAELLSPAARAFARTVTVCCATDGNHGKSVAAGARLVGCRSVIFVHAGVTQARADSIGADEIVRVDGTYDDSVNEAERVSRERGWLLVSDTSWPGYEEIPGLVCQGYTVLAEEVLEQSADMGFGPPTHVFLQAGVGGFASGVAGYLADRLGPGRCKAVIVEPERAACLYRSAGLGRLTSIPATEPTVMAMLECYTPSLIAWRILEKVAHGFMTVSEDHAKDAVRRLAFRSDGEPIVAGESGAAGLAGFLAAAADPALRAALVLGPDSRVLLINTETASDPASYARIVGRPPEEIAARRRFAAS